MTIGLLTYAFGQHALIAGIFVALTCSTLGIFIVLRRLSLISDGLGHISLAGIAAGILLGVYALWGAMIAVFAGVFGINYLRKLKIPGDAAIAIMFSAGLAIGVVLISLSGAATAELETYLFGSVLGISPTDVYMAMGLGAFVLAVIYLLFKEFFAVTFDAEFSKVSGMPVERLEFVFTFLTGLTIVITIKLVGILLCTSMIVVPAISAMLFRTDFRRTILISNLIAVFSVVAGLYVSFYFDLASGGAIVLVSIALFLMSLLYSRGRA